MRLLLEKEGIVQKNNIFGNGIEKELDRIQGSCYVLVLLIFVAHSGVGIFSFCARLVFQ